MLSPLFHLPKAAVVLALAGCFLVFAGCRQQASQEANDSSDRPRSESAAAPSEPAIGTFGFDTAGMDQSVLPGDDFYDYASGTWNRSTEIPADQSSQSAFATLDQRARSVTRGILERLSADSSAIGERKQIGDYYAAFMDQAGIEAKGYQPVKPELDAIAGLSTAEDLARALGEAIRADVDLLNATNFHTDRPFGLWVAPNLAAPARYTAYMVQGGLGMPDRDFYLGDGRMADLRAQYQSYVAQTLERCGMPDAQGRAERIVQLETAIARAHASLVETADVKRGNNMWKLEEFSQRAPGIAWSVFFAAAGLSGQKEIIVWQPGATAGFARLVSSEPLSTWKDYLSFHALDRAAPYLSEAFAAAHFAFHERALNGTPEIPDRWKLAVDDTNRSLGEAVGKIYVEDHFTAQTKAKAEEMVRNIIDAFGRRIDNAEWMSSPTRQRAKAKLHGLQVGVGYPERWRDYSDLEVRRDDAYGNARRAVLHEYHRNLRKLDQPVDRGEWFLLPQEVNALNVPLENRLIFPAAILQPPFFDAAADDAVNYGAIGGVIGHEISHSFDDSGALFDETGKLENWWSEEDFARFEAAGAALAAQYDAYKPFPDLSLNGNLTLGENIADVAGLATARDAYVASHAGQVSETLEGFGPDQRLFLGWAQIYRSKFREQSLRNRVLTNEHAPGRYRALTVRNIDSWYAAFDVHEGQALYLPPGQRVRVW